MKSADNFFDKHRGENFYIPHRSNSARDICLCSLSKAVALRAGAVDLITKKPPYCYGGSNETAMRIGAIFSSWPQGYWGTCIQIISDNGSTQAETCVNTIHMVHAFACCTLTHGRWQEMIMSLGFLAMMQTSRPDTNPPGGPETINDELNRQIGTKK